MTDEKDKRDIIALHKLAEKILDAWNSQDVDGVLSCYSEDVIYLDPNTRGEIRGKEAFKHYLRKLFSQWKMTWSLRELFPLRDEEGATFLWRGTFQKKEGSKQVTIDGMDLAILDGENLVRNEVYFDRSLLATL